MSGPPLIGDRAAAAGVPSSCVSRAFARFAADSRFAPAAAGIYFISLVWGFPRIGVLSVEGVGGISW